MKILLVFLGGGMGSVLRFIFSLYFSPVSGLPIATILANFVASIIIGYLTFYLGKFDTSNLKYIFAIGFCGGFSTFSTFSLENYNFLKESDYILLFSNIFLNLLLCIGGVFLGIMIGKHI